MTSEQHDHKKSSRHQWWWGWKFGGGCIGCIGGTAAAARVREPALLRCARNPPWALSAVFVFNVCCALAAWRLWSDRQILGCAVPFLRARKAGEAPPKNRWSRANWYFVAGGSINYTPERREFHDFTNSNLLVGLALLVTFTAYGEHIPLFGDSFLENLSGLRMGGALGVAKCQVGAWFGMTAEGDQAGLERWDWASLLSAILSWFGLVYSTMEHLEARCTQWLKRLEYDRHKQGGMALLHRIENAKQNERVSQQEFRQAELAFQLATDYCDNDSMKKELNGYALRFGFKERGFGDRFNISLNMLDGQGDFQMRTLAELPLKDVFPAEYIYDAVLPASQDQVEAEVKKQPGCDPFLRISLPKQRLETELQEFDLDGDGQLNRAESRSKAEKIRQMEKDLTQKLRDQLINVISQRFGTGHLAKDLGLKQLSSAYVFGVTYEVEDTPLLNRKLRCLVIQRKLLEQLEPGSQHLGEHDAFFYKKCRWRHLQQLKKLWDKRDPNPTTHGLGEKLHNVLLGEVELVVTGGEPELTNEFRASSPDAFVYRFGSPVAQKFEEQRRRMSMAAAGAAAAARTGGVGGVRQRRRSISRSPSNSPGRLRHNSPTSTSARTARSTGRSFTATRGGSPPPSTVRVGRG